MPAIVLKALILFAICCGCNNVGKDSIEKADSANEAKLDTGLTRNEIVIDETSSAFVVRAANNGMAEVQIAQHTQQNAGREDIKSFATMLYRDHSNINQVLKEMAAIKNITLPATLSADKQTTVNKLKALSGTELDKEFIQMVIANHKTNAELFERAMTETKDVEVRAFADSTLAILQTHLEKAKTLVRK